MLDLKVVIILKPTFTAMDIIVPTIYRLIGYGGEIREPFSHCIN
jgi:hypothetical protein